MARIEIAFPEPPVFATEIPIRIGDLNYGGHLGNDAVLAIAQEARVRFLVARGFTSELEVGGAGLVMADAAVVYLAEGTYGMAVKVELALAEVRSRGFDLLYRMTETRTGREIARVKTGMLFFDYRARKLVRMPEAFAKAVAAA